MPNRHSRVLALILVVCGWLLVRGWPQQSPPARAKLEIATDYLPEPTVQQSYGVRLRAIGGIYPYRWRVIDGELPPDLRLDDKGILSGTVTEPGDFRFVVAVTDSDNPPTSVSQEFKLHVAAPLLLAWTRFPQVRSNSIDGAVKVTNGSKDDFDLTVIVVAVNEIGKAFALGYQHSTFKAGTANFEIAFGSTLPQGAYVVHADAIAEVPAKHAIYRQQLQTPAPLQVVTGP
jgi:hypothetical protein